MALFSFNPLSVNSLECVSLNNQKCKIRSEIISVNTDESVFNPYRIAINKCKGSCNTINDPHAKLCVPDIIKNVKMSKYLIVFQELMRQDIQSGTKLVNANAD